MKMIIISVAAAFLMAGRPCSSPDVNAFDCSGVHNYPFMITLTELQNIGKLQISDVDFSRSSSRTIATRQMKKDLQRQVLLLEIKTSSNSIEAMVVNYASLDECSMPGTKVYLLIEVPE